MDEDMRENVKLSDTAAAGAAAGGAEDVGLAPIGQVPAVCVSGAKGGFVFVCVYL